MANTGKINRKPQSNGAVVRDTAGAVVGIWTEDGHSVLLTPGLARDMALEILKDAEPLAASPLDFPSWPHKQLPPQ